MALYMNKTLVAVKKETTYGTDPTLAGTDCFLVSNVSLTPLAGNSATRDFVRPYFGQSSSIQLDSHVELSFDVELASSGTAGTRPAFGDALLACGFDETITATTSAAYTPISDSFDSVTIEVYMDGILHQLTGARGSFSLSSESSLLCNPCGFSFFLQSLFLGDPGKLSLLRNAPLLCDPGCFPFFLLYPSDFRKTLLFPPSFLFALCLLCRGSELALSFHGVQFYGAGLALNPLVNKALKKMGSHFDLDELAGVFFFWALALPCNHALVRLLAGQLSSKRLVVLSQVLLWLHLKFRSRLLCGHCHLSSNHGSGRGCGHEGLVCVKGVLRNAHLVSDDEGGGGHGAETRALAARAQLTPKA